MRNAHASKDSFAPALRRPALTLVGQTAHRRPAPARQRLASLLAGLICGFVLAALAAVVGGGSPGGSLAIAAVLGGVLVIVLAHARRVTVRTRRAHRTQCARAVASRSATVVSLNDVRAA